MVVGCSNYFQRIAVVFQKTKQSLRLDVHISSKSCNFYCNHFHFHLFAATIAVTTSFTMRPQQRALVKASAFCYYWIMFNHEPKEYICPMCQVSRGETTTKGSCEADVIYRDDLITCFVAGKWWKSNPGHVIVIPNKHIENIYDMEPDYGKGIMDASKKVAIALKNSYQCDGVSTRQHNEPAGNQDVWHYHLHIYPRYEGDNLYLNHGDTYWPTQDEKNSYSDKLKSQF